ncbi:hypothetical protein Glov_2321 [Trichlorobacter lovleyi SZ]|jgi:hypothetical protein|uniref:Uncharacterized protein n=1 Tax=Trichlorobacter lovleyi (strain ATCC BAA-1151 / DSM 17278 / SZ) TaxID=398767 RepID=B3E4V1_TRIL1|nr:hypothetical protein Glov_2321 [Trichlorobacter lovleyi SZ]
MVDLVGRYHDLFRLTAEYSLLPAHLLAVAHWHGLATCVGCLALAAHVIAAIGHNKGKRHQGAVEA